MINLEFQVSKYQLLINTIRNNKKVKESPNKVEYDTSRALSCEFGILLDEYSSREEFKRFTDEMLCGENTFIEELNNGYEHLTDENYREVVSRCAREYEIPNSDMVANDFIQVMDELVNTNEFNSLYEETLKYKDELESLWNRECGYISDYVEGVIGKNSDDKRSIVFVTAPIYDSGQTVGNDFYIGRCPSGDSYEDRANDDVKTLVYMTHESMHSQMLPSNDIPKGGNRSEWREKRKTLHTLIQYLTDKELYNKLRTERFGLEPRNYDSKDMPMHDTTKRKEYDMYPYWVGYLCRNEENPEEAIRENLEANSTYRVNSWVGSQDVSDVTKRISDFFEDKKDMSPYEFIGIDFEKEICGHKAAHIENNDSKTQIQQLGQVIHESGITKRELSDAVRTTRGLDMDEKTQKREIKESIDL